MRLSVLVAVAVLAAGCSSGGGPGAPAPSSADAQDNPAVAYMDKVCTAASTFVTATKTPPRLDAGDPAVLKAEMAAYMGQMADAYNQTATRLREVGPSPVAGGDEQVGAMATTFADIAKNFSDAKAALDAADANDQTGGLQAAGDAIARLDTFVEPLKALDASPELTAAAEKAGACQGLRRLTPTGSAVPTT
ncbi:hypothetical protein ACFFSW_18765 [Saccharothrix longispora]|uniref:Small secreted protein n=1 Tax=Saccharothrix longispora TaxID=33920 RepID=A0ABU1Q467_9PSEU|nr:hypothetical protein [Saccharothrix longispora]MDR6597682.1 hypothetical protein [Saccharothrix longispora]